MGRGRGGEGSEVLFHVVKPNSGQRISDSEK